MNMQILIQRCTALSKSRIRCLSNLRLYHSCQYNVCKSARTVCTHSHGTTQWNNSASHQGIPSTSHQGIHSTSQHRTFHSYQYVSLIATSKLRTSETNPLLISTHQDVVNHQSCRLFHKSPNHYFNLFGSSESTSAWSSAIAEAEKLVGYPTSFMSLRCLLSDELANVALQARKLVGTKHPLLKTARNFVYDGKHSLQTRGLIVLLISKAAGPSEEESSTQGMVSGIYQSQRALAEISEMIHTAFLVHKGVVNLKDLLPSDGPFNVMEFGNKMAVLSGDFLLANACTGLAQLRNTKVVDLISQAIGHLTEAAFMAGFADDNGGGQSRRRLPLGVGMSDWRKYAYLSSGSLIAQSCKGALALAGHGSEMQQMAYDYGENMAIAQKLHNEIQPFTGSSYSEFGLMSAPVLLHMEHRDPHAGYDDGTHRHSRVDMRKLYKEISVGAVIQRAQELCSEYAQTALDAIAPFPSSKSKQALVNMVKAVSR